MVYDIATRVRIVRKVLIILCTLSIISGESKSKEIPNPQYFYQLLFYKIIKIKETGGSKELVLSEIHSSIEKPRYMSYDRYSQCNTPTYVYICRNNRVTPVPEC